MANEKVLISGIDYKVRKLIDQYRLLDAENSKLKNEVMKLKEEIASLQELLNKKNNEFLKLTLANAFENKFGVEKGIRIIDELVEEIDRSMDVISK
jgi:predicted nuclease with TOPRIM domain